MHASSTTNKPTSRAIWRGPFVLVLMVTLRLLLVPAVEPVLHPDSHVYLSEANQSYSEMLMAFVGQPTWRPSAYPLFLKLCGATDATDVSALRRVVLLQLLITSFAFAVAAVTVSRHCCRTRGGRFGVIVLFVLLSLTIFAGPWDGAILTESLALASLLLLCTALALAFGGRDATATAADASTEEETDDTDEDASSASSSRPIRFSVLMLILLPLSAFFLQLRDAHVPLVACLMVVLLVLFARRFRHWSGLSRIAALLWFMILFCLIIAQSRASVASGRADWPLTNVLSMRVWQSPGGFETFVHEYALPARLQPLVGRFVWDGWRDQPDYAAWLVDRGRWSYVQFLLSNPSYLWQQGNEAIRFAAEDTASNELELYFHMPDVSPPLRLHLASAVTDLLTLPQRLLTAAVGYRVFWPILAALVILAGVVLLRERQTGSLVAGAFIVILVTAQVLSTTILDACEDSRHNLLAYNALVILFWLPILILCDDVSARREAAA